MLYRKFSTYLEEWSELEEKPALLIEGARQIGKTTLIREFAKNKYGKNFAEINFITTPSAKKIFEGDINAEEILSKLSLFLKKTFVPHKTLIFFDEVQECPAVRTAIKFLVEDGRFDYIESGSLLGINYGEITSYAVGFEDIQMMYPMDFEEFAIAAGVPADTFPLLKECYDAEKPVDSFIHQQMLRLFTTYMIVGGMPAAVQEYVSSKDMGKIAGIQSAILKLYRKDIIRYAGDDKAKITNIFDTIPAELNAKNKRFKLSDLSRSARMERYESCFNWLTDAGIGLPCFNLSEVKQPLEINMRRNLFKYFFCDTGLLCALCSGDVQFQIMSGNYWINEGSIVENLIAQQLLGNGFALYYYDKKGMGEVDFVAAQHTELIPVEVKSGEDYHAHRALDNLLSNEEFALNRAIVFSRGNVETAGKITYLPLYMVMFFKKETMMDKIRFSD
ncbi:MAG: AAA family ATPase [Methanocorpusculum sp.]|nr:AAA family ATPase [Methanocorpusculum sp.]